MIRLLLCLLLLANTVEAAQQLVSTTVAPNAATGNDPKTGLPYNPAVVEFADFYQTWLNNQPKINANFAENYGSIGTIATGLAGKAPDSGVSFNLGAPSDLKRCTDETYTTCYDFASATPTQKTLQVYTAAATDSAISAAIAAAPTGSGSTVTYVSVAPTANSPVGLYRLTTNGAAYTVGEDWFVQDGVSASPIYSVSITSPTHGTVASSALALSCPGSSCSSKSIAQTVSDWVLTPEDGYVCASTTGFALSPSCSGLSLTINSSKTVSATFQVLNPSFYETFNATGYDNAGWVEVGTVNEDYTTSPAPLAGDQSVLIAYNSSTSAQYTGHSAGDSIEFLINAPVLDNTGDTKILELFDETSNELVKILIRAANTVRIYHGDTYGTSVSTVSPSTTYHFWVDYTPGTGSNGVSSLYFTAFTGSETKPGTAAATVTTGTATGLIGNLRIGHANSNAASAIIFDNVKAMSK